MSLRRSLTPLELVDHLRTLCSGHELDLPLLAKVVKVVRRCFLGGKTCRPRNLFELEERMRIVMLNRVAGVKQSFPRIAFSGRSGDIILPLLKELLCLVSALWREHYGLLSPGPLGLPPVFSFME